MPVLSCVPFLDLVTPHIELESELTEIFQESLHTGGFVGGPMVEGFERSFADYCEADHAIAVGSGTDALRFALKASGVEQGEVVVTVPNTFIATTEAITQCGALPEFVDVDERTFNISVAGLRAYFEKRCSRDNFGRVTSLRSGRRVSSIVPVHLYGQMADMDPILDLAEEFGLVVVEDACQAHGAEYFSMKHNRWMKAGTMGRAGAFSFYPGKNLGACGEGGAIITNEIGVAEMCRRLRDHGQARKYYHTMEGYNGRMDAIQAGILTAKLRHLPKWNARRREAAATYRGLFKQAGAGEVVPIEPKWTKPVHHLYVIRSHDRDELMKYLADSGIGAGIHYPVPLHLQEAYSWMTYSAGDFPVAERAAREIISLPMFPQLEVQQQEKVVNAVVIFSRTVDDLVGSTARIDEQELIQSETI